MIAKVDWDAQALGILGRSPNVIIEDVGLFGAAPHALTARYTYDVPPGKLALVDHIGVYLHRDSAATTVGEFGIAISVRDLQNVWHRIVHVATTDNTAGMTLSVFPGGIGLLFEGMRLQIYTFDDSTGGAVDYRCAIKIIEFDK